MTGIRCINTWLIENMTENKNNILNVECKMQNAKCKMQNAKCRMQNAKCRMQNAK